MTWPGRKKIRPGERADLQHKDAAGDQDLSVGPAADTVESEPRHGNLVRLVSLREATCYCDRCGRSFDNTGAAASHAKSNRHTVRCHYISTFAYWPNELLNGAGAPDG